jgi:hypothetical protein
MFINEEILAFEDFQRHQREERNEYEAQRSALREKAIAAVAGNRPAYRRTTNVVTGEKSIEPIFTATDRVFLGRMRVFA